MPKENVLIVEDDADIREGVRILLESENYNVKEAANGMDCLLYTSPSPLDRG